MSDSRSKALLKLQRYFWGLDKVTDEMCERILAYIQGKITNLVDPELLRMKAPCRMTSEPILTPKGRMVVCGYCGGQQIWVTDPMSYEFKPLRTNVNQIFSVHVPGGDPNEDPAFLYQEHGSDMFWMQWGEIHLLLKPSCKGNAADGLLCQVDEHGTKHIAISERVPGHEPNQAFAICQYLVNDQGDLELVDSFHVGADHQMSEHKPYLHNFYGGCACFSNLEDDKLVWLGNKDIVFTIDGDIDMNSLHWSKEHGLRFVVRNDSKFGETNVYSIHPEHGLQKDEFLGTQVRAVTLNPRTGHYYFIVPSTKEVIESTDPEWQLQEDMYPGNGAKILITDDGIVYAVVPGNETTSFHPDGSFRHSAHGGYCKWYRSLGNRIIGASEDGNFAEIDTSTSDDTAVQRAFPKTVAKSFGLKLEDLVLLPNDKIRAVRQEGPWILSVMEPF